VSRKYGFYVLLVFTIVANSYVIDEKAIVDGAAQFLMERAKQNYSSKYLEGIDR
jgi:hypothetical protein